MNVTYRGADTEGIAHIVLDRHDDPVNALDDRMFAALDAAIGDARREGPRAVVVRSAKPDQFVGGADLKMLRVADASDLQAASRMAQRTFDELAGLPCPVVAAINGPALGGGFELALACDWRIVADLPQIRLGLPEIQLGVIPAAGGTQRLPRLVGLPRALDLILASRRLAPRRALRAGIVDEVVHPGILLRAAGEVALRRGKRREAVRGTALERALTWVPPARAATLAMARRRVRAATGDRYPAPYRALDAIAAGLGRGTLAGQEAEARAFGELAASDTAHALIGLLLLGLRQRRAALEDLGTPRPVAHVGVVGAGFMGAGIAQAAAVAGMHVRVRDREPAAVGRGIAAARALTRDAARKGAIDRRDAARVEARLSGTTDLSGFRRADLVIEAVFEDLALKRQVVADLEEVLREDAVIASNTSALPIAAIAAGAGRPERIVGMHFFSPVHKMSLLEVVRPDGADPAAVATAVATGITMGKTVIVVRDGPGFYTTRTIGVMMAEALALLEEGARIDEVDAEVVRFGWPVGPFVLLDEVGLAVARHAGETVARARGSEPSPLLARLVDRGLSGKRGGLGFYDHSGRRRRPNPAVYEAAGAMPSGHEPGTAAERCTLAFVNEAVRCLDEGVLRSPAEGDLGAVLGLGFPPGLGGPFRHADVLGDRLRTALRRLADVHGARFRPADGLLGTGSFHKG